MQTQIQTAETAKLPFDLEFQKGLIKLMCEDGQFGAVVGKYLRPEYFEDQSLAWAWHVAQAHLTKYGQLPAVPTLRQYARNADPRVAPLHYAMMQQVEHIQVRDEQFMRDAAVSFCKRNIFVTAVQQTAREYNAGNIEEAYERLARASEELEKATWTQPDATFFFDELYRRQVRRLMGESEGDTIATGIHELDGMLGGGLSKGELGVWISPPKAGKSTMLLNMGVAATRSQMRNTAHFIFEGGRVQVENRYEAAFTQEAYQELKHGLTADAYTQAAEQYRYLKQKLWLQAFVDDWDYTVVDVSESLRVQKRALGWVPDLVIIDYGDLLSGREKGTYRSDTAKQKAAFRDLKLMASRGYAVWTASQVQRPREGHEDNADWLFARQIADCYEKVRVCDFIGSLNQCRVERQAKLMRIYGELYRDNEADLRFVVHCDFSRMWIASGQNLVSPAMPDLSASSSSMGGRKKAVQAPQPATNPQQSRAF